MQKIIFIIHHFFETLQRYCKFISGFLGMPGHAHHKQCYPLIGNSDVYPQTKNQLDPWKFSRDNTL